VNKPESDSFVAQIVKFWRPVSRGKSAPNDASGMATCPNAMARVVKALAGVSAFGHIWRQAIHSGWPMFSGRGEIPHRR
jgi:hypothetical protein